MQGWKEGLRGGRTWGEARGAVATLRAMVGKLKGSSQRLDSVEALSRGLALPTREAARSLLAPEVRHGCGGD